MRPLWKRVGERPDITELHASTAAEVFMCVGILTGWIGSKIQIEGAQETAKNLFTESITYFESVGDVTRIAAARTEIAYCYWREGELNEARIMLREALKRLTTEGDTRARAILKLATVELSAARFKDALNFSLTMRRFSRSSRETPQKEATTASLRSRWKNLALRRTEGNTSHAQSMNTKLPTIISN